jgi:hypothetical protein
MAREENDHCDGPAGQTPSAALALDSIPQDTKLGSEHRGKEYAPLWEH